MNTESSAGIAGVTSARASEVEGLHGVGDYIKLAPESWDRDYAQLWAQLQAEQHNKLVYRRLWQAAAGVPSGCIASDGGSNKGGDDAHSRP